MTARVELPPRQATRRDGSPEPGTSATAPDATDEAAEADVPQEIIDAIDAHIAAGNLEPGIERGDTVKQPDGCGDIGDLCLILQPPTVVSDTEATVAFSRAQSDAAWQVSLVKQDGAWTVTEVTDIGCC